jgi:hypothetical protein
MSGFHTNEVKFPAQIIVESPLVLEKVGAVYTIRLDTTALFGGAVWVGQLHHALRTLGTYDAVNNAVDATPSDAIRISWDNGWRTSKNDALYNFIKDEIGQAAADAAYNLAPGMII